MTTCFTPLAARAAELTITMPRAIEARNGPLLLGEYATFEGDAALADAASLTEITPSGGSIGRADIANALGATRLAGRSVALRIDDRVTIAPENPIAVRLRNHTGWKWRIEVEGRDKIPADELKHFTLPPRISPGARTIAVKTVDDDGRKHNRQVKLLWYQPIAYATTPLMRGETVSADQVRLRVGSVGILESFVWDPSGLIGRRVRQSVGAGEPIKTSDVERETVIKSGSAVTIMANVNGLKVEVKGTALQRGAVGDAIKVRNNTSKKVITGVVVDAGRVEISDGGEL